jgi:hypothetical protein
MDLFIRVLMVLPFGWSQFEAANWALVPTLIYWKIGFVVVISTFITYLLNLLTMKIKTNNLCLSSLFATYCSIPCKKTGQF